MHSEPAQAFGYWKQSLDEDYTQLESAQNMRRLAEETNLWGELVGSFEAAYGKYGADPDSLGLRLTVAQVYEQRLADLEKALAVNQEILDRPGATNRARVTREPVPRARP